MELLSAQITGLKEALKELRAKEGTFIRVNTLQTEIEKARSEIGKLEEEATRLKERREEIRSQKAEILKSALDPLAKDITDLLPGGQAVVSLDDSLFIGWQDGNRLVPYGGLSGGEKVFFDGALCGAMLKGPGLKVLVLEAAEVDEKNLNGLINAITVRNPEAQILISTWAGPKEVPAGWKVINLK